MGLKLKSEFDSEVERFSTYDDKYLLNLMDTVNRWSASQRRGSEVTISAIESIIAMRMGPKEPDICEVIMAESA